MAAAALGTFVLAVGLMPATLGMGDPAELTIALALAGIPHPTGYPLWVMLGHLFVTALHAAGVSWVMAANLWSALGAAIAAGACARLVQHVVAALDRERFAPRTPLANAIVIATPVAVLVLNPVWLDYATQAEVYSWNSAVLALAAAYLLGRLRELGVTPDLAATVAPADTRSRDVRSAFVWGLLCGTAGTLHATSVLLVVPMTAALVLAWAKAGRWRISLLVVGLAASLLPLSSYGWIAWRAAHPAAFQWPVEPTFRSWWQHVRGLAYTSYLGRTASDVRDWPVIQRYVLTWILPAAVIGPVAAFVIAKPVRWGLLALVVGAVLQMGFIASYGVTDPAPYFLPALLATLWVTAVVLAGMARRLPGLVLLVIALAIVSWLGSASLPRALAARAKLAQVDAGFRDAWRRIPFDHGIVLYADDHYHRFVLLQVLEGQRPDLYVDDPDMLALSVRRRAFERRFGFDPVAGLTFRTAKDLERIPDVIRKQSRLPVLVLPQ